MRQIVRAALWVCALTLVAGAGPAFAQAPEVDRVLVEKAARRMTLQAADGSVLRTYTGIQLGWHPVGRKQFEGDGRTPEGHYVIDRGQAESAFHLALHIAYPAPADVAQAAAAGRSAGGAIFIHGQPNGMTRRPAGDWTAGCIALSNAQIEEIWALVGDGTAVDIEP